MPHESERIHCFSLAKVNEENAMEVLFKYVCASDWSVNDNFVSTFPIVSKVYQEIMFKRWCDFLHAEKICV